MKEKFDFSRILNMDVETGFSGSASLMSFTQYGSSQPLPASVTALYIQRGVFLSNVIRVGPVITSDIRSRCYAAYRIFGCRISGATCRIGSQEPRQRHAHGPVQTRLGLCFLQLDGLNKNLMKANFPIMISRIFWCRHFLSFTVTYK